MMAPPDMMEVEGTVTSSLIGADKWLIRGDTMLIAGPIAELSFSRAGEKTGSRLAGRSNADVQAAESLSGALVVVAGLVGCGVLVVAFTFTRRCRRSDVATPFLYVVE